VLGDPVDTQSYGLAIVEGSYTDSYMKGKTERRTVICVYDKRTKKVEVVEYQNTRCAFKKVK
jgi:hypothetical protein